MVVVKARRVDWLGRMQAAAQPPQPAQQPPAHSQPAQQLPAHHLLPHHARHVSLHQVLLQRLLELSIVLESKQAQTGGIAAGITGVVGWGWGEVGQQHVLFQRLLETWHHARKVRAGWMHGCRRCVSLLHPLPARPSPLCPRQGTPLAHSSLGGVAGSCSSAASVSRSL